MEKLVSAAALKTEWVLRAPMFSNMSRLTQAWVKTCQNLSDNLVTASLKSLNIVHCFILFPFKLFIHKQN